MVPAELVGHVWGDALAGWLAGWTFWYKHLVPSASEAPRRLAMFPLGTVLFPGATLPLHVFEPRYRQMISDCLSLDGTFGVVLISRGSEVGGGDQRVVIGTEARIQEASPFVDGRWAVLAVGSRRFIVESWLSDHPYPLATVRNFPVATGGVEHVAIDAAAAAVRRALALASELGRVPPWNETPEMETAPDDPDAPIWRLCAAAPLGPMDRQRLLEIVDAGERVSVLTELSLQVAEDLYRLLAAGTS